TLFRSELYRERQEPAGRADARAGRTFRKPRRRGKGPRPAQVPRPRSRTGGTTMTWFDFGVLVVLVVSIAISLLHGLAREMVSLGVWVGGFILATLFGGHVAGFLPESLGPLLGALI